MLINFQRTQHRLRKLSEQEKYNLMRLGDIDGKRTN